MIDLSPFAHVPKLPGSELSVAPLLVLLGIAMVIVAAGLGGVRRRHIG